jgi:nucleoid DNA-binding protein
MTIEDIAKKVSKETGEPAYKISIILKSTFEVIRAEILKAQIIKIRGLMSLFIDVLPEVKRYDLIAQEVKILPRRFTLKVVPSRRLKKEIDAKKTY